MLGTATPPVVRVTVAPGTGLRVTASYTTPDGSSGRLCSTMLSPDSSVSPFRVPSPFRVAPAGLPALLPLTDVDGTSRAPLVGAMPCSLATAFPQTIPVVGWRDRMR